MVLTFVKARVKSIQEIAFQTYGIVLSVPQHFSFKPGQFVLVKIPGKEGKMNAYSLSSTPALKGEIHLCVKRVSRGKGGSVFVTSVKKGVTLEITSVGQGEYFMKKVKEPAVFVATGTGLSANLSIVQTMLEKGSKQPLHFICGFKYEKKILFAKELAEVSAKHKNFTYEIVVSRPKTKRYKPEHVQDALKRYLRKHKDFKGRYYLSALQGAVKDVKAWLMKRGVDPKKITTEAYH